MSRRAIQQLSPSLVNRIAAGEVVERPAAVVKELVENAIDAGAMSITVDVEDGGRALVRVTDDGGGIPASEMPLAFASHATSKLVTDDDLFRIATMGFRGEALASIGSVSQARILSRTADDESGWEIQCRGGELSSVQAAAANVGTAVEVRNLFYNTPARRKFIKGTATEFGYITDVVTRLALPHSAVAFQLIHNGRTTLDLPACDPLTRWLSAWPGEFRGEHLQVERQDAEMSLSGIVGLPDLARPTAKYQYVYLNGRYIRDKVVMHALRESFRGLTEPGRHPAGVILLQVPPQDVDVNVHPTKIEVRFRDSGRIYSLVHSTVRQKLLDSNLAPPALPMRSDADDARDVAERLTAQQQLAAFFKQQFSPAGALPAAPQTMFPNGRVENEIASNPPLGSSGVEHPSQASFPASSEAEQSAVEPGVMVRGADPTDAEAFPTASRLALNGGPGPDAVGRGFSLGGASQDGSAIQLHNSYLVVQSADGMLIIDQHALHERIMYEDLLARLNRDALESQRMLIPHVLDVSPSQIALLEQIQPLLGRLGIEVSAFGPTSVAVQAFPTFLDRLEPGTFVRELLERGEQELLDLNEEELLHEVLDMMACKAAVKAGDPLTPQEIESLLARRDLVERSSNCPHGRPTTLRLTLRDLEKQFKRTGF